ncbi:MAG: DUF2844 domain-containing protein [Candidatus Sulfotelmatobacter sp.]
MSIAFLLLGLPLPAFAVLGAHADSVQEDRVRLQAKERITTTWAYTIHELTSPVGTVVREYVSPGGRVFAVSWQGPFIPEMKQLLGSYFPQYSLAAQEQRERHLGRWSLNIDDSSLVVHSAGHMRAYSGQAYDPGLLPAGVSSDDLR